MLFSCGCALAKLLEYHMLKISHCCLISNIYKRKGCYMWLALLLMRCIYRSPCSNIAMHYVDIVIMCVYM